MRSLHYLNWGTLSPFPAEPEQLGQQLNLPVVKNDPEFRLWCLAAKGYTDLEINPASAKLAWTEAQQIAHKLGKHEWEARAQGELGIIGFLQGDSRRAAVMVGDALLSAKASGDVAEVAVEAA